MIPHHKKNPSSPTFPRLLTVDSEEKVDEMQTIVKKVRDRVATRTHIELEGYFAAQQPGQTTRRAERKILSLPGTPVKGGRDFAKLRSRPVSKSPSPVHEIFPASPLLADRFLSRPRISKRRVVVKGLRHIHTFLPPVQKTLDYRDRLIRDSLVLLDMRRQVTSYLLKDSGMAHDFYSSKKRM